MGYGIKCNQREIKTAPGPSDYDVAPASSFVKASSNYFFSNGGLKKPDMVSPKEELVLKYFGAKVPKS